MTWITIHPGDPPPSCQHFKISNDTWRCVDCGERMIVQRQNVETVLSAPNAAACTNPPCVAALADGTYDETSPHAGCTNPSGMYIPDVSREKTVIAGWDYRYECERCCNDGDVITKDGMIWDWGHSHRGERSSGAVTYVV